MISPPFPAIVPPLDVERGRTIRPLPIANAVILLVALLAIFALQQGSTRIHAGTIAADTVVAEHSVTYVDRIATAARQRQVRQGVPIAYRFDPSAVHAGAAEATHFFGLLNAIPPRAGAQQVAHLQHSAPSQLSPATVEQLVALNAADRRAVESHTLALLSQATGWRFDHDQMANTEIGLVGTLGPAVDAQQRVLIGEMLAVFVHPTMVADVSTTLANRRAAAAKVKPIHATIFAGQVVVRRGDLVTPAVMERLAALGLQRQGMTWQEIAATVLFSGIVLLLLFWYLQRFHPRLTERPRILLLIDLSVLFAVIGARLLEPSHVLLPYFLPVAAAPTFLAVLIAPDACVAIALVMSILAGWITASSFELTMYYFLTGAAGVVAIYQVRQLKQFIMAGLYIAFFAFVTVVAFGLMGQNDDLTALQDFMVAALVNGFVSASLALGGFAVLSEYFGVTTSVQLLELGQPNRPLLRRLMVRAPGTYNHSIIVASMVERAAQDIGADELVAKVAALYHDVGKTVNPQCFIENQMGSGNIHDEIRPDESARLIRGHVTHGLRLARQHKLPRPVLDAIAEHHGTTSIGFFQHKAYEFGGPTDPSIYTYPGPRPQSKESALIMLADGCESAVRASTDHSAERIAAIVATIFQDRSESGQLNECPLTLRDLGLAREAFLSVLYGLYHPRIDYPESIEALEFRRAQ